MGAPFNDENSEQYGQPSDPYGAFPPPASGAPYGAYPPALGAPYAPPPASGAPYGAYPPASGAPFGQPPASGAPYGQYPQPAYFQAVVPVQVDPRTGQPLSDKSKLAAGLMQLLIGGLTGVAGIGRLYAGNTGIGIAQLILSIVGWITAICLGWLIVPLIIPIASWLWVVIDGIVILTGNPVDGQGRLLRR